MERSEGEEEQEERLKKVGLGDDAGFLCHFKELECDFILRETRSPRMVLCRRKSAWRGGTRLVLRVQTCNKTAS